MRSRSAPCGDEEERLEEVHRGEVRAAIRGMADKVERQTRKAIETVTGQTSEMRTATAGLRPAAGSMEDNCAADGRRRRVTRWRRSG